MEQAGSGVIGQCRNTQIPKHEGSSKFDASPDEGYAGLQREEGENPLSPPCIPPKFVLHGLSARSNFLAVHEDTPPRLRRKRPRGLVIPGRQAKEVRPGLSLRATGGCHHPLPSPPFDPRNEHPVEVPNIAGKIDTSIWHVPPCPKSAHEKKSKPLLIHSDTTFAPHSLRSKGGFKALPLKENS